MGMISKVWNFKKALSTFIEGCTGMMEVLMILMLAWGIGSICPPAALPLGSSAPARAS